MERCVECGAYATTKLGRSQYCAECASFITGGTHCDGCGRLIPNGEKVHSICGNPLCETCFGDKEVISKYEEVQDENFNPKD